jgi:large subunit ribosomal protein L16
MALMPKSVKYRKSHLGPIRGKAHRGNTVTSGEHGIQSLEAAWVTSRQIESARITARHFLKGVGRIYIKIFPHKAQTAKPAETRMGKGKGEPEEWIAKVKPGTVMFEIGGVTRDMARETLRRMSFKLPVRARMLDRRSS